MPFPFSLSPIFSPRRWLALAAVAGVVLLVVVMLLALHQAPVIIYKLALALLAGVAGYGLDRALFPYAAPSSYLDEDWRSHPDADQRCNADYPVVTEYKTIFTAAMLRQALLVACAMLAVCLGL